MPVQKLRGKTGEQVVSSKELPYLTLGLTSSPHVRIQTPLPPVALPPFAAPSSSSLNATASNVPSALNESAEIGAGYLGSWRSRFLATGSHSETVASPPPVANVPYLQGGYISNLRCLFMARGRTRLTPG